ncbi:uncharacterized protein N0V89_006747 [Didymosphaeria variabile]|uniref:Uncharacterized protein n=1 Tax=Didymosphaeria variabile TaxID=1932322 RepID=A0A9W8XHN5_9PLEO|nr:uncharacterized protein N0V89_006747 [Didymosphaeria variabile]KAJ4351405.1 hypothetical protein N0V89_006747 [Didymosphaeria variabile]
MSAFKDATTVPYTEAQVLALVAELRAQNAALLEEPAAKDSEHAKLQEQNTKLKEENVKLQEKNVKLKEEKVKLQEDIEILEDSCAVFENDINVADSEQQHAVNDVEIKMEYDQKIYVARLRDSYERKIAHLKAEKSQLGKEVAKLKVQCKQQMDALENGMAAMHIRQDSEVASQEETKKDGEEEGGL